jgi:hypothetical protein
MFGSNFMANFGIPDFPYQGTDAQGGYLGANAAPTPMGGQSQNAAPSPGAAAAPGPAATPPLGQSSPLAGGPLSPGGGQPQTPPSTPEIGGSAPAAGIGSPFGRPPNG